MAKIFGATTLTGGGATALDSIDGNDLADGDAAVVVTDVGTYHYHLNATSAATENSPLRIAPDSNAGDKRWHLVGTTVRIGVLVKLTANESVPNSTSTTILWDAEEYDDASFWEGVTHPSRITIPVGVTNISLKGQVTFGTNSVGKRALFTRKNGASFLGQPTVGVRASESGETSISCFSPNIVVSASDYFELNAYQASGGALDIVFGNESWFSVEAVGFA